MQSLNSTVEPFSIPTEESVKNQIGELKKAQEPLTSLFLSMLYRDCNSDAAGSQEMRKLKLHMASIDFENAAKKTHAAINNCVKHNLTFSNIYQEQYSTIIEETYNDLKGKINLIEKSKLTYGPNKTNIGSDVFYQGVSNNDKLKRTEDLLTLVHQQRVIWSFF